MANPDSNFSEIVASARTFLDTFMVLREFPGLTRIDWLMLEKFFRIASVSADSSIMFKECNCSWHQSQKNDKEEYNNELLSVDLPLGLIAPFYGSERDI